MADPKIKVHFDKNCKNFVIGDIHGNFLALKQCLERSQFDYDTDQLICLGDIVDGQPQTKECIEELLKIKNLILLKGNHDEWALDWYDREYKDNPYTYPENIWTSQGGLATLESYGKTNDKWNDMIESHLDLLKKSIPYYIDKENRLFVHAGIDPNKKIEKQSLNTLIWDRDLLHSAWQKHHQKRNVQYGGFKEIFIGHTTTQIFAKSNRGASIITDLDDSGIKPLFLCNIISIDTGAGFNGRLTIMNIETKEYWQSDLSRTLYPEHKGR
jgi:serine/threonine protein phosphatase 1